MKGLIALDVDGTITDGFHSIPQEVILYLETLYQEGWHLAFVTGRPYKWSMSVLRNIKFPYILAVQNGAISIEMPSKEILDRKYLDSSIFSVLDQICESEESDYVVYKGFEFDDICYYRPSHFSHQLLDYVRRRVVALEENYYPLASYASLQTQPLSSIKCFGDAASAKRLTEKIEAVLGLHVTSVNDPFDSKMMVVQATHPQASKGDVLQTLKQRYPGIKTIGAGNDYNDASLLEICDIAIVMGNAPADLKELADVLAPPVHEKGIIEGLKRAVEMIG